MNAPGNPQGVAALVGLGAAIGTTAKTGMDKIARARKKRQDHFQAGHQGAGTWSGEHLDKLISAAKDLHESSHQQTMEKFNAMNAASKPGKSMAISPEGGIQMSEKSAKQPKQKSESAAEPAAEPKAATTKPSTSGSVWNLEGAQAKPAPAAKKPAQAKKSAASAVAEPSPAGVAAEAAAPKTRARGKK
jgi:hypothetical protein